MSFSVRVLYSSGCIRTLETYWQQSYHQPPPWQELKTVAVWQAGTRVHTATAIAMRSFWAEVSGQAVHAASAVELMLQSSLKVTAGALLV